MTKTSTSERFAWVGALCLSWACHGAGRPLVDRLGDNDAKASSECLEPAACDDEPAVELEMKALVTSPVPLESCGGTDAACDLEGGLVSGGTQGVQGCALDWELVSGRESRWPSDELVCASVHLRASAALDVPALTDVAWQASNVVIESSAPLSLVLDDAWLENVWLELRGPVHLRFQAKSSLTDVRIVLIAEGGEPRVELVDADTSKLIVSSQAGARVGSLSIIRSRVAGSRWRARDIALESVVFVGGQLDADRLTTADAFLERSTLSVGHALLASSKVSHTAIVECGTATITGTALDQCRLLPCRDGPLRVYGSKINDSTVDGHVESDSSGFSLSRLGRHAGTRLVAWDTALERSSLCSRVESAHFGGECSARCSTCGDVPAAAELCELPGATMTLSRTACAALEELDVCEEPETRERPTAQSAH